MAVNTSFAKPKSTCTPNNNRDVLPSITGGRRRPLAAYIKENPTIFDEHCDDFPSGIFIDESESEAQIISPLQIHVNAENGRPLHRVLVSDAPNLVRHLNLFLLTLKVVDLEQRDACDRTPLHLAVLLGDIEGVDILLKAGCKTTSKCHDNNLLHLAAMSGECEMFEKVRALGFPDPAQRTSYLFNAMHIAAMYNHCSLITHLASLGVDLNPYWKGSGFPRQCALPVGRIPMTAYTLQSLAVASQRAVEGALLYFCFGEAKTGLTEQNSNSTLGYPLVLATAFCCIDAVKCLIEHGSIISDIRDLEVSNILLESAVAIRSVDLVALYFEKLGICQLSNKIFMAVVALDSVDILSHVVKCCHGYDILVKGVEVGDHHLLPSRLSLADYACFFNRPAILEAALKWEQAGTIFSSGTEPVVQIILALCGSWIVKGILKLCPISNYFLTVSSIEQVKVVSILSSLPKYNLLEFSSNFGSPLDFAAVLCQPEAYGAIVAEMRNRFGECGPDLTKPLIPACVVGNYTLVQKYSDVLSKKVFGAMHLPQAAEDLNWNWINDVKTTIQTLCAHGYDINAVTDFNGEDATCFDMAMELNLLDLIPFLRDSGAVTYQHLAAQERAWKLESRVHQTETERSELKKDKDELAKENEKLQSRNNQLVSYISQLMQFVQPLSSLVSTGLPSGVNCAAPNPSTSITLSNGEELTAYDIRLFAPRWKDVCVRLGVEQPLLEVVEANHPSDCEAACRDMLKHWISKDLGTGTKPRTLDTLCRVLELCECGEYVKRLQERHRK